MIHTILGSCIAVCLWDHHYKFGGMSHYILNQVPWGSGHANNERNVKYGEIAIPYLIKLMKGFGSKESQIKAHVIGGGEHPQFPSPVGAQNAELADRLLSELSIEVMTRDVKGSFGRKVIFNSGTGEVAIHKIHEIRKDSHGNCKTEN